MSDHHNQYHLPPQQQQPQELPYPVGYHETNPRSPVLSTHPIPSSSSSASATEDSRGSASNKRSSQAVDVVAQTPSTSRSTKKAKKSSPGDSGSVRSSGTTSAARGLRHFSMMVCQKVEEKGTTTYNEVADELVKKVVAERRQEDPNGSFDQKNIRRRVYDALNVLMAMDIISKQKKEITWKGLPTAAKQDMESMSKDIEYTESQLAQKKETLKDLLTQQVCFRNLVQRNYQQNPHPIPHQAKQNEKHIRLPFIVINTNKGATLNCDMAPDRTNVMFDFSLPFELKDDNTILKRMGMDRTNMSTLRQMLPEDLLHYCEANRLTDGVLGQEVDQQDQMEAPPSLPQEPPHEVTPYHHQHRGTISIGSSSRGRLHDHHAPPPPPPQDYHHHHHPSYHHPPHHYQQPHPSYDHHPGSRVRVPSRHQYPPPGAPSAVSSSRRGMRDPYSY